MGRLCKATCTLHSTLDFCPTPARKETNVPLHERRQELNVLIYIYCAKGIVYIGDSVGAHFHVPATWFTPSELTTGILTNVSYVISNEFDWPDVGFATGFRNATQMPKLIFDDHVDSLYLRLRERNRCNHRDYQVSHSK